MVQDKEIISRLQQLKQVKPNKEWVFLIKNQILGSYNPLTGDLSKNKLSWLEEFSNIFKVIFTKKLAYALPVFLLTTAGAVVFLMNNGFPPDKPKIALSPFAASVLESDNNIIDNNIIKDNLVNDNLEMFKIRSQYLANAARDKQDVAMAVQEVREAAKNLTDIIHNNPKAAKSIALDVNNNKTYLSMTGEYDLKETSDALYKAIDSQMIEDLKKATLTEEQEETLQYIIDLYNERKYSAALENILLFNIAREKN